MDFVRKIRKRFFIVTNIGNIKETLLQKNLQGGAGNVIPLIVHVTHFYYYKNI